jgi:GMP synthase (glutamine-hydrolysing)
MTDRPLLVLMTGSTVPTVMRTFGDFDAQFRRAIGDAWAGSWATADAQDVATALPAPSSLAGVIVSGSPASVTDRARTPWMLRLEEWLRAAVAEELPLLGVCFGHQILAQALGGEVRRNPRGRRLGSVVVSRLDDDPLFEGMPRELSVSVSHQDHVGVAPPGVRPLVRAPHDELHAFAAGHAARAVQFHPEFSAEIVRGYVLERRDALRDEGQDPSAVAAAIVEPEGGARVLRNFVRHFVRAGA